MKNLIFIILFFFLSFPVQTSLSNPEIEPVPSPPSTLPSFSEPAVPSCANSPCIKMALPSDYKVVFHNNSGQTHILISRKTSPKQIEKLIYYFAETRKNNELGKIGIPPTGDGDYSRGSIVIFKEPRWARGEKLINPRLKEKTYNHHIIAEYIWNNHNETAYLGQKTLFSNSYPRKQE